MYTCLKKINKLSIYNIIISILNKFINDCPLKIIFEETTVLIFKVGLNIYKIITLTHLY